MLEPDPFVVMAQDDEPVAEGLFLVTVVGVLVGAARVLGGLLLTASLPSAAALHSIMLHAAQSLASSGQNFSSQLLLEFWQVVRLLWGYGSGWAGLLGLLWEPILLLGHWLVVGAMLYVIGRALGGTGTLRGVLGASALVSAPSLLLVVGIFPFAIPGSLLVFVWGLLLLYRAAQMAHDLTWQRAAVTATVSAFFGLFISLLALLGLGGVLLLW